MPISDTYLIQLLVQETKDAVRPLLWSEKAGEGYVARSNGVGLELENIMDRAGARKQLTLCYGIERVQILEPGRTGIFTEQYASEEDWRLVRLMRELYSAAARQCAAREDRSEEALEAVKQAMFRRVMGASEEETEGWVQE